MTPQVRRSRVAEGFRSGGGFGIPWTREYPHRPLNFMRPRVTKRCLSLHISQGCVLFTILTSQIDGYGGIVCLFFIFYFESVRCGRVALPSPCNGPLLTRNWVTDARLSHSYPVIFSLATSRLGK
jgi:hypothetical protein